MDPIGTLTTVVQLVNEVVRITYLIKKNQEDIGKLCRRLNSINTFLDNISSPSELTHPQLSVLNRLVEFLSSKDGLRAFMNSVIVKEKQTKSISSVFKKMLKATTTSEQIHAFNVELDRFIGDLTLMFASAPQSPTSPYDPEHQFEKDPIPYDSDDDRAVLGKGAFGKVYRMKAKNDGRIYAVKSVNVRDMQDGNINITDLQSEIDLLCKLTHPNIVRYFTSYYSKQKRYFNLAMELAEGGTLAAQIKTPSNPLLSDSQTTTWMKQTLSALVYMHSQHILHRDVKPENLLLDNHNNIKVADVGLAVVVNSGSFANTMKGTATYMSYEKAHSLPYDGRDDVWAVGCVLVELLTNRRLSSYGGALYEFTMNDSVKNRRATVLSDANKKSVHLSKAAEAFLQTMENRPNVADALDLINIDKKGAAEAARLVETQRQRDEATEAARLVEIRRQQDEAAEATRLVDIQKQLGEAARLSLIQKHQGKLNNVLTFPVNNNRQYFKIKELVGHFDKVWSLCPTKYPIGNCMVSGCEDKTIRIWNADTGVCKQVWDSKEYGSHVAVLKNGNIVNNDSSDNGHIHVYNYKNKKCLLTLSGHVGYIYALIVSCDENIVSGSADNTIRIWHSASGGCLKVLEGHTGFVSCLIELPNANIASGSWDSAIRIWNIQTGECVQVLDHTHPVYCLCVLSDGRLVSGNVDRTIRIWKVDVGVCEHILEGHTNIVWSLSVLSNDHIVSGSFDKTIRIWNTTTFECEKIIDVGSWVYVVKCLPNNQIVGGGGGGNLCIWG